MYSLDLRLGKTLLRSWEQYGKDLPQSYLNRQGDIPLSITQAVLSESGAFSAWEKVEQ